MSFNCDNREYVSDTLGNFPLVTVYLLLYRKFDKLYQALDSVLCQTYCNIELIVSDDGSGNFPAPHIRSYIEANRRENVTKYLILDNKENVGTVRHINNVLSRASGDLYVPLAGDDAFFDQYVIEKIVGRYRHQKFNLLATSSISYDEKGDFLRFYPHVDTGKYINKYLNDAETQNKCLITWRFQDIASGSTMVISASFFKKMGGHDEDYRLWEDGPFLYAMTGRGYKIETAYDIISIKYSQGGVSSNGGAIIRNDIKFSVAKTRSQYRDFYGLCYKRLLDYIYYRSMAKSLFWKKIINLLFLDSYFILRKYQKLNYNNGRNDLLYFKKLQKLKVLTPRRYEEWCE